MSCSHQFTPFPTFTKGFRDVPLLTIFQCLAENQASKCSADVSVVPLAKKIFQNRSTVHSLEKKRLACFTSVKVSPLAPAEHT